MFGKGLGWDLVMEALQLMLTFAAVARPGAELNQPIPLPEKPTLRIGGETWQLASADGTPPVLVRTA